jgi:hypothetical protein
MMARVCICFASLLLGCAAPDRPGPDASGDAGESPDADKSDASVFDAGPPDAGLTDGSYSVDAGSSDGGACTPWQRTGTGNGTAVVQNGALTLDAPVTSSSSGVIVQQGALDGDFTLTATFDSFSTDATIGGMTLSLNVFGGGLLQGQVQAARLGALAEPPGAGAMIDSPSVSGVTGGTLTFSRSGTQGTVTVAAAGVTATKSAAVGSGSAIVVLGVVATAGHHATVRLTGMTVNGNTGTFLGGFGCDGDVP